MSNTGIYAHLQAARNEIDKAIETTVHAQDDRHAAIQEIRMAMQRLDVTRHHVMDAANRGDW